MEERKLKSEDGMRTVTKAFAENENSKGFKNGIASLGINNNIAIAALYSLCTQITKLDKLADKGSFPGTFVTEFNQGRVREERELGIDFNGGAALSATAVASQMNSRDANVFGSQWSQQAALVSREIELRQYAEERNRLKKLLDDSIISQEEYNKQKADLEKKHKKATEDSLKQLLAASGTKEQFYKHTETVVSDLRKKGLADDDFLVSEIVFTASLTGAYVLASNFLSSNGFDKEAMELLKKALMDKADGLKPIEQQLEQIGQRKESDIKELKQNLFGAGSDAMQFAQLFEKQRDALLKNDDLKEQLNEYLESLGRIREHIADDAALSRSVAKELKMLTDAIKALQKARSAL
jgi:hypothetical protein